MNLYDQIAEVCALPHGWTSVEQGVAMADAVIRLRAKASVEIGVYAGKGLTCLGLAHKEIDCGCAVGIDPYSPECSTDGQIQPADVEWWGKVDYKFIEQTCRDTILRFRVGDYVRLVIASSETADVPEQIGVLRIDGNHGPAAIIDAQRFAPNVVKGGLIFLDDIDWSGGSVACAMNMLLKDGWKLIKRIGNTAVLEKV